jgi:hypothetical protein
MEKDKKYLNSWEHLIRLINEAVKVRKQRDPL